MKTHRAFELERPLEAHIALIIHSPVLTPNWSLLSRQPPDSIVGERHDTDARWI